MQLRRAGQGRGGLGPSPYSVQGPGQGAIGGGVVRPKAADDAKLFCRGYGLTLQQQALAIFKMPQRELRRNPYGAGEVAQGFAPPVEFFQGQRQVVQRLGMVRLIPENLVVLENRFRVRVLSR